ncbi:hypothetical protein [Nocardia higoensis]|uniref:hypothetical protein n=1 Tax=Nocardia higoensis TaxID=228599 RepID=UPI002B4B4A15|nr:hypothetical protein [Nocardia higoensis]
MTGVGEPDGVEAAFVDDVEGEVAFGLEEVNAVLAGLVTVHAQRRQRDAEILAARLGVGGEAPQTLAAIGARFDLARDRVRQLHTRTVGHILRETHLGGAERAVFAERYPLDARDSALVRRLLAETYATDADLAANELSFLKLRLAGHTAEDAKRVAGYVVQRIMGWQKKMNRRLAALRDESAADAALDVLWPRVDWPESGREPAPLPTSSARVVDEDDDQRGRFYLDKVGRDVGFDSALRARLLLTLNAGAPVRTFQEEPMAISYRFGEHTRLHHPSVAAELMDGRVVLIDVQPLGHVGFEINRVKAAAAREHAHANGWGVAIWTGSRTGVAELRARKVDAGLEQRLAELVAAGPVRQAVLHQLHREAGLELLDLAALTLRHGWRWERTTFTISAATT